MLINARLMISKLFLLTCLSSTSCALFASEEIFSKSGDQQTSSDPRAQHFSSEMLEMSPEPSEKVNADSSVKKKSPTLLCDGYIREFENMHNLQMRDDIKKEVFRFYYDALMYLFPKVIGEGTIETPRVLAYNNEKKELFVASYCGMETWDTENNKIKKTWHKIFCSVAYNKEEKILFYKQGMSTSQTQAFDVQTLKEVNILPNKAKEKIKGTFMAYVSQGNVLFYINDTPSAIHVLDAKTFKKRGTLEGNFDDTAYDRKKKRLFTAETKKITVWNLTTFKEIGVLKARDQVSELVYDSEENRLFAIGDYHDSSNDRIIEVWNLDTFKSQNCTLEGNFRELIYDSRSKVFFAFSRDTITAWDARTVPFEKIRTFKGKGSIATLVYDSESKKLFSATYEGRITEWASPYEIKKGT